MFLDCCFCEFLQHTQSQIDEDVFLSCTVESAQLKTFSIYFFVLSAVDRMIINVIIMTEGLLLYEMSGVPCVRRELRCCVYNA